MYLNNFTNIWGSRPCLLLFILKFASFLNFYEEHGRIQKFIKKIVCILKAYFVLTKKAYVDQIFDIIFFKR